MISTIFTIIVTFIPNRIVNVTVITASNSASILTSTGIHTGTSLLLLVVVQSRADEGSLVNQ